MTCGRPQIYSLWAFYRPWQPIYFENGRNFEESMLHEENKLDREGPKYQQKVYIIT